MAQMPDVDSSSLGLSEGEDRLRIALDNMPGALVYTDVELNIVFCNDRFRAEPTGSELYFIAIHDFLQMAI